MYIIPITTRLLATIIRHKIHHININKDIKRVKTRHFKNFLTSVYHKSITVYKFILATIFTLNIYILQQYYHRPNIKTEVLLFNFTVNTVDNLCAHLNEIGERGRWCERCERSGILYSVANDNVVIG